VWGCLKLKDGYIPPQTIQKIGQADGKTAKEIVDTLQEMFRE